MNPSIEDLQKEIRMLKRKLALTETNLDRARHVNVAQDRVESILNTSMKKDMQFFELVLENTTNIVLLFDSDGRFAYASRAFLRDAGIANFGFIGGRHYEEVLSPILAKDNLSAFNEALKKAVREKCTTYLEEEIVFGGNGEFRTYTIHITPMFDEDAENAGIMAVFNDITEINRNMQKIREADEQTQLIAHWYKSILDAVPLPLSVTDTDMKWTYINRATEKYLGKKREDLMGLHCHAWGTSICNTVNCGIACIKRGIIETYFTQGESSYHVDISVLHNMQGETAGYIEIVQDVSNIQNLAKERADAEAANNAKSAFLAVMSHEIRTPMNAILGITEVQMQNRDLPGETASAFTKIFNSANVLMRIVNDLLDLSKIESRKFDLHTAEYSLAGMINDTVQLNIMRIYSKPIEFKVNVCPDAPITLLGDELRIEQILSNLLSNAFKYTDTGEVELKVHTERHSGSDNKNVLVVSVRDTGRGMTREQLDKLFDEYTRFNNGSSRNIEGIGLGMNITRHLVGLMDGEISVESSFGKGSLFTVRIPQGDTGSGVLGEKITNDLREFRVYNGGNGFDDGVKRRQMPGARILVVDDLETNIYVVKGLLSLYGISIDTAVSGFDAVKKISGSNNGNIYDIIFMDHMMPGMDGVETTAVIRSMGYKAPIVALTANALSGTREMLIENGFDDYLSKPINTNELNNVLEKWIKLEKQLETGNEELRIENAEIQIKGLDVGRGMMMTGGSLDTYLEILSVFYNETLKNINVLNRACGAGDLAAYTTITHALKSASSSIGSDKLSKAAEALEMAGLRGDIDFIREQNGEFVAYLEVLLESINVALPDKKVHAGNIDSDRFTDELLKFKSVLEDYDINGINSTAQSLQEFLHDGVVGDITRKLLQYKLTGEYDEAVEFINDILKR